MVYIGQGVGPAATRCPLRQHLEFGDRHPEHPEGASATDVDLYTHVVDNKEADDIFRAFFLAGVAEIEASTDLALAETMYRAAWKHRIGYVFEGHSFLTEGITPVGRNYFDGRYIESIHSRFGTRPMRTYPLMTFSRFMFWSAVARIRKIRPFWYIDLYEGGGAANS